MSDPLLETPLARQHEAAGARMVPFSGWNMPVQYADGILAEHQHTRQQASLFDCSHMGQFRLTGSGVAEALDTLLPRLASTQKPGTCRYNFLLAEDGTVIDDIIVYRVAEREFYLVVNAGTQAGDAAWLRQHLPPAICFADESAITAKLDLQGPRSAEVLAQLGFTANRLPAYFHFKQTELDGMPLLLSRTGYTGELGFELYFGADHAAAVWARLLAIAPVKPAGLGARDTLRLEMGYPLYGHELSRQVNPVQAGFDALIHRGHAFIGRDALTAEPAIRLVGIRFDSRRAARDGAELRTADGRRIGQVSSGCFSPSLGTAIALGYVETGSASPGTPVVAVVGRAEVTGTVVETPFYAEGTVRNQP